MSRRFVITRTEIHGKRPLVCAVYEEHRMLEVNCIPENAPPQILNNIYVARVSQVVKNIGAAFVEIAKGQRCFLPLDDLREPVYVKRISAQPLVQGDELLVQIVRESVKTKEPQVTTTLSLAGIYCVVTSTGKHRGISSKLPSERRARLRELATDVYDERFGLVVRTNACDEKDEVLLEEIQALTGEMSDMTSYAHGRRLYDLVYQAPPEYIRLLQNQPLAQLSEVVTDDVSVFAVLEVYAKRHPSTKLLDKLHLYEDAQYDLHKLYSVQVQLERALQKKVWLKSGANLVIEPTEALTVIDVNSSKNVKKKKQEEQRLLVNLEAAKEAARQLRLRNLSGIIVIDFIDMASQEAKEQLLTAMREFVRQDPVKTEVVDLTRLGLMELTRKKMRRPLHEQLEVKPSGSG